MSQHEYTSADPLVAPAHDSFAMYGFWAAYDPQVGDGGYAAADPPPPGVPGPLRGTRASWWSFTPVPQPTDIQALPPPQVSCYGYIGAVYLDVWRNPGSGWVYVGGAQADPPNPGINRAVLTLTGTAFGQPHLLRLANVDPVDPALTHYAVEAYYLFGARPPLSLAGPPADTGADTPAPFLGPAPPLVLAAPPADTGADTPAPRLAGPRWTLAAPPADTGADTPPPVFVVATATPIAPSGIAVPGRRPAFTVSVTVDRPGQQVQVQWARDAGYTTGVGAAYAAAPAGLDDAQVIVQPGADLPDGEVWWRARITGPLGPGEWSTPVQFAVNGLEGQAVVAGERTVVAGATPAPHLWHIDIAATGSDAGQPGLIAGTGFGPTPTVLLGALPCPVTAAEQIPADITAADQLIVPGGPITVWHEQIAFTIPEVDPDHVGDALTVERS